MNQALDLLKSKNLSSRHIALGGLFLALSIILGSTGWGMLPLPTPAGAVTTMHIPVLLAGIVGGPYLGAVTGLVFGFFAWQRFPAFDPLVHILPRIIIAIVAWAVFKTFAFFLKQVHRDIRISLAAGCAAAAGTLTNTVGVLSMAVFHGYFPLAAAITIGLMHGIPEIVIAVVVAIPLVSTLARLSEIIWKGDDLLQS